MKHPQIFVNKLAHFDISHGLLKKWKKKFENIFYWIKVKHNVSKLCCPITEILKEKFIAIILILESKKYLKSITEISF